MKLSILACFISAFIASYVSALSCTDITETDRFLITSVTLKTKRKNCKWGKKNPTKRCKIAEVEANCRDTCSNCCADAPKHQSQKFEIGSKNRKKSCKWVKKKPSKIAIRCAKPGVQAACPDTCDHPDCKITPAPSSNPTSSDSTPSASPTRPPSPLPSPFPTLRPTSEPSDTPSEFPSDEPSLAPSNFPSDQPSEHPSLFPSDSPSELVRIFILCTRIFICSSSLTLRFLADSLPMSHPINRPLW